MSDFDMAAALSSAMQQGAVACETCDADMAMVDNGGNVYTLEIRHDPDCPTLTRHQAISRREREGT
ncbi:hypothetical protein BA059_14800 [Mycolicibacterium sp. (ex Dasyatis americana)]|nr:hypothetical protein BA059_14800 [Mycolicibacterium sp. (ex Dasyatis americana)]